MTQVISGDGGSGGKAQRWRFIVVLMLVIALAAGVGAAIRLMAPKQQAPTKITARSLPDVVTKVQNLRIAGKSDQAQQEIDAALANQSTSQEVRYLLYIQAGNLRTDKGKSAEAIPFYKQAAAIKETYEVTSLLADTYLQAGDKPNALVWYKKALPLVPKENNPLYQDDKQTLEDKIKSLEAGS